MAARGARLPNPLAALGERKCLDKIRVGDSFPLAVGRVTVRKIVKHVSYSYALIVEREDGSEQRVPSDGWLGPDIMLSGIKRTGRKA